jgi:hypothetical protein
MQNSGKLETAASVPPKADRAERVKRGAKAHCRRSFDCGFGWRVMGSSREQLVLNSVVVCYLCLKKLRCDC